MNITITSRNFEYSNALKEYAEKKNGGITVKLVATGLKDLVVMNLLAQTANNPEEFFEALLNYSAKSAEEARISPADRSKIDKSGDSQDVKDVQKELLAKGFSLEAINASMPNRDNPLDAQNKNKLNAIIREVNDLNASNKEIDLPIFINNEKKYASLDEAIESKKINSINPPV
jgi:uncharacterized protein (UPF0335 family)